MSVIPSQHITLGEAIQKISIAIYHELTELLYIFNKVSHEGMYLSIIHLLSSLFILLCFIRAIRKA